VAAARRIHLLLGDSHAPLSIDKSHGHLTLAMSWGWPMFVLSGVTIFIIIDIIKVT